ncbi:hypothetical protein ACFWPU_44955 [Streptomyces sp. NPDC058471]|uniref:hypothetical protein n=1 Tax=Streptomyces sp. NPDC058471 TaxID=3346516 RepID=UPI003653ADA9
MIRLPASNAAVTAPLVASDSHFPGILIGRSELDGRAFHLSPVLADSAILPSTNSLALGGLGSGKSATGKVRIRREILEHGHQAVVIDSFGEDSGGEWGPLTRSLGGQVIEAGQFTLNPCSTLLPPEVREQLVRSLIAAVEPGALTYQSTHALQSALNHPKATNLNGLVDALVAPEEGRWSAEKLATWGEGAAIALSRYTEGSLRGLFDGQEASLPPVDLPILSFDFSHLDRNSPAIPSLMAAVSCWAEHVWLRQSTAVHRHLVLEEAWQILLSPATAELIQRLLKNSRKAALSLDVLMHTLSDLGEGKATDLARLCEVAHVGRLNPEEAEIVGALLGLPAWAIREIPNLSPGQAVWKVGPHVVDIVKTVLNDEEARLTDTSSRRRQAQEAQAEETSLATEMELDQEAEEVAYDDQDDEDDDPQGLAAVFVEQTTLDDQGSDWGFEMPSTVVDTRPYFDDHQYNVIQVARQGRCSEAADLAALGEREAITAYGIFSDEAVSWVSTRAKVADLCGSPATASQLRATVTRMGKEVNWWDDSNGTPDSAVSPSPGWRQEPPTPDLQHPIDDQPPGVSPRRKTWFAVSAVASVALAAGIVWQATGDDQAQKERQEKAATYKGRSGAALTLDGVDADIVARWSKDGDRVIVELRSYFDENAKYLRIDGGGEKAASTRDEDRYPQTPEIAVPIDDRLADVTVRVAVGGKSWKEGDRAPSKEIRLSPTGAAYDAETGKALPSDL